MKLWVDKNPPNKNWLYTWLYADSIVGAMHAVMRPGKPVTLISVSNTFADELLRQLDAMHYIGEVVVHNDEPSPYSAALILQNHWDKPVLQDRTAELIMVLKGNHDLHDACPDEETCTRMSYLDEVALYMSDDCDCSFAYYKTHPNVLKSVIEEAVKDFANCTYTPHVFLYDYFEARNRVIMTPDGIKLLYNETEAWCVALTLCNVRDNTSKSTYVNGFTEYNTQAYKRQRPFIP